MVYRRRFRKYGYRKRANKPGAVKRPYMRTMGAVRRQVGIIRSMVNSEKKFFDSAVTGTAQISTGNIYILTNVNTGLDVDSRVGNSILTKYVYGRLFANNTGNTDAQLRMIIFYDTDNTGTDPIVSQVLQNTTVPTVSPMLTGNVSRFWIVYDKTYSFDSNNQTRQDKYFRYLNIHQKFTGPTSTDYSKNALYVLFVSTLVTVGVTVDATFRIAYYDN